MESVYLETTVIGHIVGRLHPDPTVLVRQQASREWWRTAATRYRLFISDLVITESGEGDADAAQERLAIIDKIDVLRTMPLAKELAASLIAHHAVPATEPRDALHIAIAATNGIDYLVTWNFKHIMNPSTLHKIDATCRNSGIEPSTICTPEQLLVTYDNS